MLFSVKHFVYPKQNLNLIRPKHVNEIIKQVKQFDLYVIKRNSDNRLGFN